MAALEACCAFAQHAGDGIAGFPRFARARLAAVLLASLAACDGTAGIADAGPDAPATPAGVWRGTTSERGPLSFVLSEDGTVTDLELELRFKLPSGDPCVVDLRAVAPAPMADGVAHLALRGAGLSFLVPLELRLDGVQAASGTIGGFSGAFRLDCGPEPLKGEGDILPASTLVAAKTGEVSVPQPKDLRLSIAAPAAVPVGSMSAGCSHQPGSARVFCAFGIHTTDGRAQLWVVEPSRLQGPCPGPACLKLTDNLWMDERSTYRFGLDHGFAGDTLLFRADSLTGGGESFEGPMYAWRPGWGAALRLVENVWACTGDETSDAVYCLDDFGFGAEGFEANLFAGRLGDGTVPLRGVDRILLGSEADFDAGNYWLYQIGFAGGSLLWSARPRAGIPETLHLLDFAANAPPRTLGTDVTRWTVSADGRRLFWVRPTDQAGVRQRSDGPLEMIDLPAGGAPRPLGAAALSYLEVRNPSRLAVHAPGGELILVAPGAPIVVLDRDVTAFYGSSSDGHFLVYSKAREQGRRDLRFVSVASPRPCAARLDVDWFDPRFSSSGRYAVAGHYDAERRARTVELIDSLTCQSRELSLDGYSWLSLSGDRFLLLTHALPLRRFAVVDAELVQGGPTPSSTTLQTSVSGQISVTERPAGSDIVFSIDGGWQTDGLYHRTLPAKRP